MSDAGPIAEEIAFGHHGKIDAVVIAAGVRVESNVSVVPNAVRRASPDDAAQIGVIHVRSWQSAYRGLLPQEYLDRLDPADRAERWQRILHDTDWSRGGVLVIAAGAEVAGFTSFGPTRDDDDDPAQVGEITSIYVLPQAWGMGLGPRLMTAALEHLANARYVQATLWVLDSNARARRFYAKGGWIEDGAVKQDDSRGFPLTELRYRRPLPSAGARPSHSADPGLAAQDP